MNVIDRVEGGEVVIYCQECRSDGRYLTESFECKNELISLAKIGQQMQWISVSERLPERPLYDWVLVAIKLVPENWYGVPHIAELRNGVWYSNSYNAPFESTCGIVVTHWMPLPKRPKDGDNK